MPSAAYDRAGRALTAAVRAIGLAALLAASGAVHAEPYAFAAVFPRAQIEGATPAGDFSGSNAAVLFLGAGYRFSKHVATELSYLDPGSAQGASRRVEGGTTFSTLRDYEARGFGIAAVGMLPLSERFSLLARAGVYRLTSSLRTQDSQAVGVVVTFSPAQTIERTFWAPSIGAGAEFHLARQFRLRAMLEQMTGRGELDRIRLLSLQAVYSF